MADYSKQAQAPATKTIRLRAVVHVVDKDNSKARVFDTQGRLVEEAFTATKEIAPGEDVTLPAAEADKLLARFGGEEVGKGQVTRVDPASTDITRVTLPPDVPTSPRAIKDPATVV